MAAQMTVAELRDLMKKANATWTIDERLKDADPVPIHAKGADLSKVPKITDVPRTDIKPSSIAAVNSCCALSLFPALAYASPAASQ